MPGATSPTLSLIPAPGPTSQCPPPPPGLPPPQFGPPFGAPMPMVNTGGPQEIMVCTRDGKSMSQTALLKKQSDDVYQLRQRLDYLTSMLQIPEKRWHPQDDTQPYTWEEFLLEAEKQLFQSQNGKGAKSKGKSPQRTTGNTIQLQIRDKAYEMWSLSSKY